MLVRAFGASAFGLRGGIPMEADQVSDLEDYIFPFVTSQFEVRTGNPGD